MVGGGRRLSVVPRGVAVGLHVLLDTEGDDAELTARLARAGVRVHPLSWHRVEPGPGGIILGYGAQSPERLRQAVARMAAVLR